MKGHDQIMIMRREKKIPAVLFINDFQCNTDWLRERAAATICTHGDVVQTLDMRFVVGLKVSICSDSETRAKALFEKCKASGAHTVAACHLQPNKPHWEQNGWAQIWHK